MRRVAFAFIVTLLTAALPCRAGEPAPAAAGAAAIHWNADAGRFEVTGLSAETLAALRQSSTAAKDWPQRFGIYVVDAGKPAAAPLLGQYAVDGMAVTFQPRFALRPGLKYRAAFQLNDAEGAITSVVEIPFDAPRPAARVQTIHPSGDKLPENLLKFYIHFSAPMSRGEAYERLHIVDVTDADKPREVPDAFLRLGEELWDASGQRFTLLFDPGRIKRGLTPNIEEGAPLVAGRRYAFVIDREWRDAHNQPLAKGIRKEFEVTPFDDKQPDPRRWPHVLASAGTKDSILFGFDEPLDHALAGRCITVRDATGNEIAGLAEAVAHDTAWNFTPERPWVAGDYVLVVDPVLEDLAGNSVGRAFETRVQDNVDQGTSADAVTLPFRISSP